MKIRGFLEKNIIAAAFATAICSTVIACFASDLLVPLIVLTFGYTLVLFAVFERSVKRKFLGSLFYAVVFITVMAISINLVQNGFLISDLSFSQWLYTSSSTAGYSEYFQALYIGGVFFIASVVYYFSNIIYRAFGNMLLVILPMALFSKRDDAVDRWQVGIVAGLFIVLMISRHLELGTKNKKPKLFFSLSYYALPTVAICVAVLFTASWNQPVVVSRQEADSGFLDFTIQTTDIGSMDSLSQYSSRYNGGTVTNRIFFYVTKETDDILYLRRQAFDNYTVLGWLYNIDNANDYVADWQEGQEKIAFKNVYQLLSKAKRDGIIDELPDCEPVSEPMTSLITANNYGVRYLPAPIGVVSANVPLSTIRRSTHGEFSMYYNGDPTGLASLTMRINYYPDGDVQRRFAEELGWTLDEYRSVLEDIGDEAQQLLDDLNYAETFYNGNYDVVADEIGELATEITADCTSDYEKAVAIERYFEDNGFIYDMDFQPIDDSPEYFLFNSQRGICTDFATAMTLLARSVGLTARYVEGFVVSEQLNDEYPNYYVVRELHSHAFVEVYIAGVGWMTFEPTVAGFLDYADYYARGNFVEIFTNVLIILAILGAVVMIFLLVLKKPICEKLFRIKLAHLSNEKAVIYLYNHILKVAERREKVSLSHLTPQQLAEMLEEKYSADLIDCAMIFEKAFYGKLEVSDYDIELAKRLYLASYKRIS